jgi:hypothetical protein
MVNLKLLIPEEFQTKNNLALMNSNFLDRGGGRVQVLNGIAHLNVPKFQCPQSFRSLRS